MAKSETDTEPQLNGQEPPAAELMVTADPAVVPNPPEENDTPAPEPEPGMSEKHGVKRRASAAFNDDVSPSEEFRGSDKESIDASVEEHSQINNVLERLEAEVSAATESLTPLRHITVSVAAQSSSPGALRINKKLRHENDDSSRPSSALSMKSDGDGTTSDSVRPRRSMTELSSPLLRVPLERGWRRELVYRAALDTHARRNADIYYYTPAGKKLRSSREVAENLPGTGLTLENFSFFKESLGLDDPEKEIIRDAKLNRRNDSPLASPALSPIVIEGKRTPKPKAPKGVSPEPAYKSPQSKYKVKIGGSRLSAGNATSNAVNKGTRKFTQPSDNNNSNSWKKPRLMVPPPPPLQSRPQTVTIAPDKVEVMSPPRQLQPCSMACAGAHGAVPSLACDACLCLYHPVCAGVPHDQRPPRFLCKNCRTSTSSPPLSEPPPLTHKSGLRAAPLPPPPPLSAPPPLLTPVHAHSPSAASSSPGRVLLRMKMDREGPGGSRVWSVARPRAPCTPQGLATLNGRRFILVPRSLPQTP